MKKAKIMLTAITVLAVVGGALAFKVKEFGNVYCKITKPTGVICEKQAYTTQFINGAVTTTNPCPEETLFYTGSGCAAGDRKIETLNTVTVTDL